jgi:hypothetical protein
MPSNSKGGRLEQDELVRELVPDPGKVPNAKMFVGLLGAGGQQGYWRLYFTTELKDFLEIREEDILLSKSLRTQENPLGGTALWVRADAEIQVTRRSSREREAEFLTGRITAAFLQGAAASGFSLGGLQVGGAGIKSIPPVESCVPALCLPPPPPPDPPGTTAVCTLSTKCRTEFLCL